MVQLQVFSLVILLAYLPSSLTSLPLNSGTTDNLGFRVDLTRTDASKGFSRAELMRRAIQHSRGRIAKFKGIGPISVLPSDNVAYIVDLSIGTPPQYLTGIMDTGSDLVWTQCKMCKACLPQVLPLYDPFQSSSYKTLPCSHKSCHVLATTNSSSCQSHVCQYTYSYLDQSATAGTLGTDTFTLGSSHYKVRVPHRVFGCSLVNSGTLANSTGTFGFGRSPLSLVSQVGADRFSYCFTSQSGDPPAKSPLFFGSLANLTGPNVQTISLIVNKPTTFYYFSLVGITVGRTRLPIPPEIFQVKKDKSGGIVVDTGSTLLMLVPEAYEPLLNAFKSQMKLPVVNGTQLVGLDLCFKTRNPDKVKIPKLVFNFQRADWEMPVENYMFYDDKNHLICLMAGKVSGLSIFGNLLMQNMHILFDLKNEKLSFMPAKCDQL